MPLGGLAEVHSYIIGRNFLFERKKLVWLADLLEEGDDLRGQDFSRPEAL